MRGCIFSHPDSQSPCPPPTEPPRKGPTLTSTTAAAAAAAAAARAGTYAPPPDAAHRLAGTVVPLRNTLLGSAMFVRKPR